MRKLLLLLTILAMYALTQHGDAAQFMNRGSAGASSAGVNTNCLLTGADAGTCLLTGADAGTALLTGANSS